MIKKLLFILSGRLPCRLITRDGEPYLERYFLFQAFGVTAYLHRFVASDGDDEVHNHPWSSVAVCLSGGYDEERVTGLCVESGWQSKRRRIFACRPNRIRANDFHCIERTEPETWTLFIHGKKRLGWGFLRRRAITDREKRFLGLVNQSERYNVTFHQPFELTSGRKWWLNAPAGWESARAPLYSQRWKTD